METACPGRAPGRSAKSTGGAPGSGSSEGRDLPIWGVCPKLRKIRRVRASCVVGERTPAEVRCPAWRQTHDIAPLPANGRTEMNSKTQFHVMSGRRVVATKTGPSAREVALDYLRAMGCKRDEIIYYGLDGVSWRGAVYRAQLVETSAV
jgi:hypothetical protein